MDSDHLDCSILNLVAEHTRRGSITWQPDRYNNTYQAYLDGQTLELQWSWWYDREGITLDRQSIRLNTPRTHYDFAWGTEGMTLAVQILSAISSDLAAHFERGTRTASAPIPLVEGTYTNFDGFAYLDVDSMALGHLLQATRAGCLRWRGEEEDPESYWAEWGGHLYGIELIEPVTADDIRIGSPIARVTIPGMTFCQSPGTSGVALVHQILADGISAYDERIRSATDLLGAAIQGLSRGYPPGIPRPARPIGQQDNITRAQVGLLLALIAATREGQLRWSCDPVEGERYSASINDREYRVEMLNLMASEDKDCPRDVSVARLSFDSHTFCMAPGTVGMGLTQVLLAAGINTWGTRLRAWLEAKRLDQ